MDFACLKSSPRLLTARALAVIRSLRVFSVSLRRNPALRLQDVRGGQRGVGEHAEVVVPAESRAVSGAGVSAARGSGARVQRLPHAAVRPAGTNLR